MTANANTDPVNNIINDLKFEIGPDTCSKTCSFFDNCKVSQFSESFFTSLITESSCEGFFTV